MRKTGLPLKISNPSTKKKYSALLDPNSLFNSTGSCQRNPSWDTSEELSEKHIT